MMELADYRTRYATIRLERHDDGVLEMTLHTRGGEARWGHSRRSLHNEFGLACADIARDRANKVVVLSGTGDDFMGGPDPEEPGHEGSAAEGWERGYEEGVALVRNLLAVPVPVIAAVNGRAHLHAELAVLNDIVLASDTASFSDPGHVGGGFVPGDGAQTIWPMLLGPNRGRYFLLTGQVIGAEEALRLGIVGEVLPPDRLRPRALDLAHTLARLPTRVLRHTRTVLVRGLRRQMVEDLELGLALEALGMLTKK